MHLNPSSIYWEIFYGQVLKINISLDRSLTSYAFKNFPIFRFNIVVPGSSWLKCFGIKMNYTIKKPWINRWIMGNTLILNIKVCSTHNSWTWKYSGQRRPLGRRCGSLWSWNMHCFIFKRKTTYSINRSLYYRSCLGNHCPHWEENWETVWLCGVSYQTSNQELQDPIQVLPLSEWSCTISP